MNKYSRLISQLLALGLTLVAAQAQAAIDVSTVVTTIGEGTAACIAIGTAMLAVWAIAKVYKLVRSM